MSKQGLHMLKIIGFAALTAAFAVSAHGGDDLAPTSQPSDAAIAPAPVQRGAANPAAPKEEAGQKEGAAIAIDGGIDFPTAYYFRGYKIEDSGLIVQPYGTLHYNAIQTDALSISPYATVWNSFHSNTDDASDYKYWNEFDFVGGVELSHGDFTLNVSYDLYVYPNGHARQQEEIGVILSYDDSELTKKLSPSFPISINPHVGWYHEIRDRQGSEDTYLELGVEPKHEFESTPWTVSVPMIVGTSLDGYYTDSAGHNATFGYMSAGVKAAYQLNEHWSLNAGITYQRLWAASAIEENDGGKHVILGTVGVAFSF